MSAAPTHCPSGLFMSCCCMQLERFEAAACSPCPALSPPPGRGGRLATTADGRALLGCADGLTLGRDDDGVR